MPIKVDISPDLCRVAFEAHLSSLKRALNTTRQPAFKPIIQKDLATMYIAIDSITELPPDPTPKKGAL